MISKLKDVQIVQNDQQLKDKLPIKGKPISMVPSNTQGSVCMVKPTKGAKRIPLCLLKDNMLALVQELSLSSKNHFIFV